VHGVRDVTSQLEFDIRAAAQRLTLLKNETAALERKLSDAQLTVEHAAVGRDEPDREDLAPCEEGYPEDAAYAVEARYPREAASQRRPGDRGRPAYPRQPRGPYAGPDLLGEGARGLFADGTQPQPPGEVEQDRDAEDDGSDTGRWAGGSGRAPVPGTGTRPQRRPARASTRNRQAAHASRRPAARGTAASAARTASLVSTGRRGAPRTALTRRGKLAVGTMLAATLAIGVVIGLSRAGASWPPSVATIQQEAARACQNPDVRSEPGQVNFACAKASRQILWVFALMTSGGNPNFTDPRTGRVGLEPITPAQGGELAWSLNLHHPYNPRNPVDSLAVAARAINNIVGGATVTTANGNSVVQPGLESYRSNCRRYTGSAALTARAGFPSLCAKRVTGAGQQALVADIYRRWMSGAAAWAADDAALLFAHANDPGNPAVQAVLKRLRGAQPAG
jgi:hypothetical protein